MALKMGPWGFHLADTPCPGPSFIPSGVPNPCRPAVSPTTTHTKVLTTRKWLLSPEFPITPLPTQGGAEGRDSGSRAVGVTQHQHQTSVTDPFWVPSVGQPLPELSRVFTGYSPVICISEETSSLRQRVLVPLCTRGATDHLYRTL